MRTARTATVGERVKDERCPNYFGGLAQLARAPALHAGGQRFESVILHLFEIRNAKVHSFRSTHEMGPLLKENG